MNNIKPSQGELVLTPQQEALAHLFEMVQSKQTASLVGKFLTIIESSISDPVQREAIKSVTKQIAYNEGLFTSKFPYGYLAKSLLNPEENELCDESNYKVISDYDIWIKQFRKG